MVCSECNDRVKEYTRCFVQDQARVTRRAGGQAVPDQPDEQRELVKLNRHHFCDPSKEAYLQLDKPQR